jgi:predicted enzyme related to lactoylglutathione lyase
MKNDETNATLDTVIILTVRMKELANFYQQGLDLKPPTSHGDKHLGFHLPNAYIGFDKVDEHETMSPGPISIWFRVDDIEMTFNRFKEMGAKVKYPPTKKPWGDVLAAIYDQDGNTIGLAQR